MWYNAFLVFMHVPYSKISIIMLLLKFPTELISAIMNGGDVIFDSSNQDTQQCVFVDIADDSIVEASTSFSLQLVPGIQNERIIIQPQVTSVTVEDDDSK